MYRDHTVAAVVPAYNESGYVGAVIDDLPPYVDRAYVIDDGSTDDTWTEIREHAAERNAAHDGRFDRLVVPIQHDENRGVGGAIKTGYLRAREEEIDATVVLGGDDQMDPAELTRYLDPVVDGVAGYTKGNRFARAENWERMPRFRLIGNVALSYLTKVASGYWDLMDSQNGYTAISLSALRATDIEGMYEYYGYCNDLLVRLNVAGVRVGDVPRSSDYAYSDGWKSHIDYKEYVPRVSAMLLRSFLWRLRRKHLLTSYDPLGVLYLLGMGVLGTATAGLATALARRKGAGSWFLSFVAGAVLFFYASVLDRRDNEDLGVQLDPATAADADDRETTDASDGEATTATDRADAWGPPASIPQADGGSDRSGETSSDDAARSDGRWFDTSGDRPANADDSDAPGRDDGGEP